MTFTLTSDTKNAFLQSLSGDILSSWLAFRYFLLRAWCFSAFENLELHNFLNWHALFYLAQCSKSYSSVTVSGTQHQSDGNLWIEISSDYSRMYDKWLGHCHQALRRFHFSQSMLMVLNNIHSDPLGDSKIFQNFSTQLKKKQFILNIIKTLWKKKCGGHCEI